MLFNYNIMLCSFVEKQVGPCLFILKQFLKNSCTFSTQDEVFFERICRLLIISCCINTIFIGSKMNYSVIKFSKSIKLTEVPSEVRITYF